MKTVRVLLTLLLLLGILSVVFLTDIPTFMRIKRGQIKDYNTVTAGELQVNDPVRGTVEMTIGACAEKKKNSSSTTEYYVLWMPNNRFILYETGKKDDITTLNRMCDEAGKYLKSLGKAKEESNPAAVILPETKMEFEGVVAKPSGTVMDYFREYYSQVFGTDDFDQYAEVVMISQRALSSFNGTVIAGLICAALFVILAVVTIILYRKAD